MSRLENASSKHYRLLNKCSLTGEQCRIDNTKHYMLFPLLLVTLQNLMEDPLTENMEKSS